MRRLRMWLSWRGRLLCVGALCVACTGTVGDGAGEEGPAPAGLPPTAGSPAAVVPPGVDPLTHPAGLGVSGVRRLSRSELQRTLVDLLGVDPGTSLELLPEDIRTPFDNDYTQQVPSQALVEGLKSFANELTEAALADPSRRQQLVGCTPAGADDATCLQSFVERFGRRALRRPLSVAEVQQYVTAFLPFATQEDDFYVAAGMVMRALLQDMEFIYRIELGEPTGTAGVLRLRPFELSSRLSFLLWGAGPDDDLLDAAAAGELETADQVRVAAASLVQDARAADQVGRLHAMWLGYDEMPIAGPLADKLRTETDALLRRVLFDENLGWSELFTFDQTFVDAELAAHYDLPPPTSPGWVDLDGRRAGLLSHGSFLSAGTKFGDSSPTLRGKGILERLLCRDIPPPPGSVDTDIVPPANSPSDCKPDRYTMTARADCSGCHTLMDPLGFGLENYGPSGEWRDHEIDRPDCGIDGAGELPGLGSFNGAPELGQVLATSGELEGCFMDHFHQFALGRPAIAEDAATVESIAERFGSDGDFVGILLEWVSSEGFRHRVLEAN